MSTQSILSTAINDLANACDKCEQLKGGRDDYVLDRAIEHIEQSMKRLNEKQGWI